MFNLEVDADLSGLDNQAETIQNAPQALQDEIASTVLSVSQDRTDSSINQPIGSRPAKTIFTSPQQQRWWFGVGRFNWAGRKPKQDWVVDNQPDEDGGLIVASNPMIGAQFVFGQFQQRMFVGVWMTEDVYAEQERPPLADDLAQAWYRANGLGDSP